MGRGQQRNDGCSPRVPRLPPAYELGTAQTVLTVPDGGLLLQGVPGNDWPTHKKECQKLSANERQAMRESRSGSH